MSVSSVKSPFQQFFDLDGKPLNGNLYIGLANQDPRTNPIAVYWDENSLLQAAQPIKVVSGYPSRNGSPAVVYVNNSHSMRVENNQGKQVFYSAKLLNGVVGQLDAETITYQQAGTGAVTRSVQSKLREFVSAKDFGAVGDGVTDDTAAIQAWLNAGGNLFLPDGVFLVDQVTATSNSKINGVGALKAKGTQNSVIYILDKSNVVIDGIGVDGDYKVLSCIRGYSNTGTLDTIIIRNCNIRGAKNDVTLQYGGVEISRLGSNRANNIIITNNYIHDVGGHGAIVAYGDNITISDNVFTNIGQHGTETVDCTKIDMTCNRVVNAGTVGPGGSGVGVGTHCSDFAITGNSMYNCGGDASITVEHNSIRGTISGNTVDAARTAGINVSFGTPIAAPYDIVRDITISGNTLIGDGVNTTTRSGILVYSDSSALGAGVTVTGNVGRKFNIGLNMSYIADSTVSGNTFSDYVGSASHAMTFTYCRRIEVVGNSGGACSGNVVQILNQSTNHCGNINITGLSGSCTGLAMIYVEGDLTHVFTRLDTTSASSWVFAASAASTISVIACRGNLSSTPIIATLSGVILGNNPPTHDYLFLNGGIAVRTGAGTPEGVVTAQVGSLFLRSDGGVGTTLYVKQTGGGNTGWAAK